MGALRNTLSASGAFANINAGHSVNSNRPFRTDLRAELATDASVGIDHGGQAMGDRIPPDLTNSLIQSRELLLHRSCLSLEGIEFLSRVRPGLPGWLGLQAGS